jgi:hypothetical protein
LIGRSIAIIAKIAVIAKIERQLRFDSKRFIKVSQARIGMPEEFPEICWIAPGDNPWNVRLLDMRPVTQGMLATSADPQCAANALSFSDDDGSSFSVMKPNSARTVEVNLRYRLAQPFAEGALFTPTCMEDKWAIFYRGGQILFVRSWTRELYATAAVKMRGEELQITAIQGDLVEENEQAEYKARVADYIIRSHALDLVYPVPLTSAEEPPSYTAMWCFQGFGRRAWFATPDEIPYQVPEQVLHTRSVRP